MPTKNVFLSFGEVAEWSIATVLKTVEQQCSVSSNLTFSSIVADGRIEHTRA